MIRPTTTAASPRRCRHAGGRPPASLRASSLRASPPLLASLLLLLLFHGGGLPLLRPPSFPLVGAQTEDYGTADYYCGLSWEDAADRCAHPCPLGEDDACADALGPDHGCYYFTGCKERIDKGEFASLYPPPSQSPIVRTIVGPLPTYSPTAQPTETEHASYCGASWVDAMLRCREEDATREGLPAARPCTDGGDDDCTVPGEACQRDVDCRSPLRGLETEIEVSLDGVGGTMDAAVLNVFVTTLTDVLALRLAESRVSLESLTVVRQLLGYSFDYVDVTLALRARYRPPGSPFDLEADDDGAPLPGAARPDLNKIVRDHVNDNSFKVVLKIKQNAARIQTRYFHDVEGIRVGVGRTFRPTLLPTEAPTEKVRRKACACDRRSPFPVLDPPLNRVNGGLG